MDGLAGFKEAIAAVYPQAQIQQCVIHMLRNSFKCVNYSDLKKFSSDFKAVYHSPNESSALSELEKIKEKWGKKYPYAASNWENNWEDVSSFFQFSDDIRRIMYTTNIIEGLNRQYRKVTKKKSVFPSDSSLKKMLYLASGNVIKKRTQRYRNWDQVLNQMIVLYGDRITQYRQRPHIVFLLLMPDWYAEKSKYMYKHKQTGNAIIKEEIRQRKTNTIRQQISTYLILIKKDFYP